ncbi:MAG: hypothetical protein AAF961_08735 [Planctomycetota bacterium]
MENHMSIVTCRQCQMRVIPSAQGECPSCGMQQESFSRPPQGNASKATAVICEVRKPSTKSAPKTSQTLNRLEEAKQAASGNAARQAALHQMKMAGYLFGFIFVFILGTRGWDLLFSEEKTLERWYRSLITDVLESAARLSQQAPGPGDFEELTPAKAVGKTPSSANTVVFSLQSVNDPHHAVDDRLPLDRVDVGVPGMQREVSAMYDWRPPQAVNVEGDGMYSLNLKRGCDQLTNTEYLVLVRFVSWVAPKKSQGMLSVNPGYAAFDTFLFDLTDESLIASKRHRVDQSGSVISARPGRLENDARRELVKAVDEKIRGWLFAS